MASQLVKVNFKQDIPVDPTDQVMLRLKLLDALMDMSKFLLAFKKIKDKVNTNLMRLKLVFKSNKRLLQRLLRRFTGIKGKLDNFFLETLCLF